jgi:hypothetical protein
MTNGNKSKPVYVKIMETLFKNHAAHLHEEFQWDRPEITEIANKLGVNVPSVLPEKIVNYAKPRHWLLLPNGKSKYRFVKAKSASFEPDMSLRAIKIPNSTPQIVERYALGDEQAVLARIRYNRLIDLFLGVTSFSLQNHLRTTVEYFNRSQIETDEIYAGVDKSGTQFVIPVQAKGERELIGAVQAVQDLYCCKEKFPNLVCRAVAAQTIKIAKHASGADIYTVCLMELGIDTGTAYDVSKLQEKHFELVLHSDISDADLAEYRKQR